MLGQMMWFKRFCDGEGLAFDFAVDFDSTHRNRSSVSVHRLLFSEQLRANLELRFTKRFLLTEFFAAVRTGAFSNSDGPMLITAVDSSNSGENNVWRMNAFQLHCLRKGYLSERFPYWGCSLENWTKHGALWCETPSLRDESPERCLIHLRLGDCAVLYRDEQEPWLADLFEGEVCASNRFFSGKEFDLYRYGLHPDYPERHYAERGARAPVVSSFVEKISELENAHKKQAKPIEFAFATDGFTRAAETIHRPGAGVDRERIEKSLNGSLRPIVERCSVNDVGEAPGLLGPALRNVVAAKTLVTGPSLFGISVKTALQGECARDNWYCVNEVDSLSRHLQLPSLVDVPLAVYEARLVKELAG